MAEYPFPLLNAIARPTIMLTATTVFLLASHTSNRTSTNPHSFMTFMSSILKAAEASMQQPAPKRRRLGETILDTALNAALIGTAVGITAFKL